MSGAQQQQQVAQPAQGMRRIPIPLESYEKPEKIISAKRLLNFYAEQEPADARSAAALIPTPGLVPTGNVLGAGPVLALNSDMPGAIYGIAGTHAYRVTSAGVTDLGAVGTAAGSDFAYNLMPTIAVGVNAAVFCVPPNAFTCNHVATSVNQIGGTFPGARSVAYLDGYFVFTSVDLTSNFFSSLLLDPLSYDALDFAFADGVPNVLRRVVTVKGELWLIGDKSIEIWYDAGSSGLETTPGTSFFPFRRQSGGVIQFGAVSMRSCAVADNSLFWVSEQCIVMRSVGYTAKRISTHAIEEIIRSEGTANIQYALCYTQLGHTFYCLTYGARTLVYDLVTQVWHERSSAADGSTAWRPNSIAQVGEQVIFGDSLSGNLIAPNPSVETDMGVSPKRIATLPGIWANTRRAFMSRLEVEMEVGGITPPGTVTLEWSDDGGYNYTGSRTMYAGTTGDYRGRVFCTRLGSFRQRVLRFSFTHRATVLGVDVDVVGGSW